MKCASLAAKPEVEGSNEPFSADIRAKAFTEKPLPHTIGSGCPSTPIMMSGSRAKGRSPFPYIRKNYMTQALENLKHYENTGMEFESFDEFLNLMFADGMAKLKADIRNYVKSELGPAFDHKKAIEIVKENLRSQEELKEDQKRMALKNNVLYSAEDVLRSILPEGINRWKVIKELEKRGKIKECYSSFCINGSDIRDIEHIVSEFVENKKSKVKPKRGYEYPLAEEEGKYVDLQEIMWEIGVNSGTMSAMLGENEELKSMVYLDRRRYRKRVVKEEDREKFIALVKKIRAGAG